VQNGSPLEESASDSNQDNAVNNPEHTCTTSKAEITPPPAMTPPNRSRAQRGSSLNPGGPCGRQLRRHKPCSSR
jgi:hypothetical protein